jgi:hypothetical protein
VRAPELRHRGPDRRSAPATAISPGFSRLVLANRLHVDVSSNLDLRRPAQEKAPGIRAPRASGCARYVIGTAAAGQASLLENDTRAYPS